MPHIADGSLSYLTTLPHLCKLYGPVRWQDNYEWWAGKDCKEGPLHPLCILCNSHGRARENHDYVLQGSPYRAWV